jgi:hypothetical protein
MHATPDMPGPPAEYACAKDEAKELGSKPLCVMACTCRGSQSHHKWAMHAALFKGCWPYCRIKQHAQHEAT